MCRYGERSQQRARRLALWSAGICGHAAFEDIGVLALIVRGSRAIMNCGPRSQEELKGDARQT